MNNRHTATKLACGVPVSAALVLTLFCVCSLAGMFYLNSIGYYGQPYADKPDSAYTIVDINTVINERLANPFEDEATVKYMDYVAAYGYAGNWHKNVIGTVWVPVYADPGLDGNYFNCSLEFERAKQVQGLNIGDYVYIKGQVGGNGKSGSIQDKYLNIVYCSLRKTTASDAQK